ncbi:hypothetical protein DUI87_12091 [Hirundo rustica rustica]|uniref:Retroviral Gag polyprotein M domain-containing protein n=1 Tax=Hirundo rustica rustica TaxID=333673 RepID=A0A3M0KDA3_HIRRU|nr:hypothetical protein DUI87_12091 [Hirundo rustica rustica]
MAAQRLDQLGGEDAPGPARRMEGLVKVISQIHNQWGIDCKPKDFTLTVLRLLQIGVIERAVVILHPEIWDKCTKALAEETMSSGSGKNLKLWGKVVQALQKALQEQETRGAAQNCLRITPQRGVGVTTHTVNESGQIVSESGQTVSESGQTVSESCQTVNVSCQKVSKSVQAVNEVGFAECKDSREQRLSPKPSSPGPPTEGKGQAKSFWDRLAEEARNAAAKSESKSAGERPPPYAPQDGAEPLREGRNVAGGTKNVR